MNGEVIKSFLVGLGFGVDEASLSKFNKAISSASLKIAALYAGINAMATGIFYGISKIADGFEQMGYEYRLIAPAMNRAIVLRQALLQAYSAAGVNLVKVIQQSIRFNLSLQKTKFAFQAIAGSVASKFFPLLTKQMDIFRSKIYANMPKIQKALQGFVEFIFKAFEGTVHLGQTIWSILGRVYDFFAMLDSATGGWSTKIIAVIAAWKLLNLEFLATPLGMILAGLVAILAVYDDFKTHQEGGQSFFNWDTGPLKYTLDLFTKLWDIVKAVGGLISDIFVDNGLDQLSSDLSGLIGAFSSLNGIIDSLLRSLHSDTIDKLLAWTSRVENNVASSFGGGSAQYSNPANFATPPIGANGGNVANTQSINQTNHLTYNGVSDPKIAASATVQGINPLTAGVSRNMKAVAQ